MIIPYHRPYPSPPYSLPLSPSFPPVLTLSFSPPLSQSPFTRYHFPRFLVPGLSTAKGFALAFQAGSPDVSEFSLAILQLNELGFLGKLTRKWWDNVNNCPVEQVTSEYGFCMYISVNLSIQSGQTANDSSC